MLSACIFLSRINSYWKKVLKIRYNDSNIIEKGFDIIPVYNENHLKTKVKSCAVNINANFGGNKIPRDCSKTICLSVIVINSV